MQRAAAELSKLSYQDGAFEEKEEIFTNLKHEVNAMRQQVSFKLIDNCSWDKVNSPFIDISLSLYNIGLDSLQCSPIVVLFPFILPN